MGWGFEATHDVLGYFLVLYIVPKDTYGVHTVWSQRYKFVSHYKK